MAIRKTAVQPEGQKELAFTKAQLLESKRYAGRRDLLNALLDDGGQYTAAQVDALVEGFMKRKVK